MGPWSYFEPLGFWVLDFGFWILGFGFWILGFGFWVLDFGFWVLGFRLWAWRYLEAPGGPWRPLELCKDTPSKNVPGSAGSWKRLKASGGPWRPLGGGPWRPWRPWRPACAHKILSNQKKIIKLMLHFQFK